LIFGRQKQPKNNVKNIKKSTTIYSFLSLSISILLSLSFFTFQNFSNNFAIPDSANNNRHLVLSFLHTPFDENKNKIQLKFFFGKEPLKKLRYNLCQIRVQLKIPFSPREDGEFLDLISEEKEEFILSKDTKSHCIWIVVFKDVLSEMFC